MLETSYIIAGLSAAVLTVAVVAWVKLFNGPALQRMDGGREPDPAKAELASQMLIVAVGLSAIAAILAVIRWFAA